MADVEAVDSDLVVVRATGACRSDSPPLRAARARSVGCVRRTCTCAACKRGASVVAVRVP
jgi:hypothetical protein